MARRIKGGSEKERPQGIVQIKDKAFLILSENGLDDIGHIE